MPGRVASKEPKRGFTVIEIVVVMAITAILLTIIGRTRSSENISDRARSSAAAAELSKIVVAATDMDPSRSSTSFRQVIGGYPAKLSQLTTQITTADKEICGSTYLGTASTNPPGPPGYTLNWTKPFYYRQLGPAQTILSDGYTANDAFSLTKTPGTPGVSSIAGVMAIVMPSVALLDAEGLDLIVDGTTSGVAGTVQYNAAADPTSVSYYIYISGC